MGEGNSTSGSPVGDEESPPSRQGESASNASIERVAKPLHEQSPLLSPSSDSDDEEPFFPDQEALDNVHQEDGFQETKGLLYMVLLTISIGGLQLAWAVELSNGTPYLLSLGLSKSLMALVWIAGPLSGAIVQPYVGMLSDTCRSPWGKRTPFMVFGSLATIASLLALAWVREIVGGFLGLFGADRESNGVKNSIIVAAVLFIYILDFAINTVQAGIRAFILDCAPAHQQEAANSMASRVVGVGNIIGYIAGYIDLPEHLWFFGNTQFKVLCVIACLALSSTVALSISQVRERDPRLDNPTKRQDAGLISFFTKVFKSIRRLPPQTRKVCEVQFLAWVGFFPQLFYSSSYIGDIYVQPYLEENPHMTPAELDVLYENATRVGTFALLIYAITSLITNLFLPFFVAPSFDAPSSLPLSPPSSNKSHTTFTTRFLNRLVIPWLTLRRAWMCSHIIFAVCMGSTLFARSIGAATTLVGIVGISWALTLWAPFAIISAEISKRDALRRSRPASSSDREVEEDQAGVILGIHNMAVAAPQMFATIGSSIIFKFLQKERGVPGDRSISVVLASGGIFTLAAAWLVSRIEDEVVLDGEDEGGYVAVEEGFGAGGRRSSDSDRGGRDLRMSAESRRSATLIRSQSFSGVNY